jgi:hypothetical protein
MSLPAAVVEQERIADELLAADLKSRKEAAEAVAPVVAPTATPDPEPTKATDPAPPASAPDAPAPKSDDEATWQSRYNTLNGKYLAEVPRLHTKVKELTEANKKLTEELTAAKKPASLLTDEEIEKYGLEFWDAVGRAAEQRSGERIRSLESTVQKLTTELGTAPPDDKEVEAKTKFFVSLAEAHEDWEAIDDDPKWKSWLQEYDPVARVIRQALLNDAIAKNDAAYVASLLTTWKTSKTARQPTPPPAAPAQSPEPSTSKADPPDTPAKKIWTRAEIAAFYKKQSKGGYSEKEGEQIEQEITTAIAEKRVA